MNSKLSSFLFLIVFGVLYLSCRKEEEKPIINHNIPTPSIILLEPATDSIFSKQAQLRISIKSEVPAGIKDLEYRLYRFGPYDDTINVYHHWEGGEGTTIQVEKTIKRKVNFNSRYWIKASSRDTMGNRIDSNFFFCFGYAGPRIQLHTNQLIDKRYNVMMQFNKTNSLLLHIYAYTFPKTIVGTIKEKGTNKVLSHSEFTDLSSWSINSQDVTVKFNIAANPMPGDTTFAFVELIGTDANNDSTTSQVDCFIVD